MGVKIYVSLFNRVLIFVFIMFDIFYFSGFIWLNNRFVNRIIDFYISSVFKDDRLFEY